MLVKMYDENKGNKNIRKGVHLLKDFQNPNRRLSSSVLQGVNCMFRG